MRLNRIAVFVVATVCLGDLPFAPCRARDIYVPAGASIQEAVDAASPGDIIVLGPGEHLGNVNMQKDRVALRGSGADVTIIRALRWKYVVMAGKGARIQGLTIADGETGVWAHSDDIIVADCAFTGNQLALALGGSFRQRPFAVEGCFFWGNTTGVSVDGGGGGHIRDCEVLGNETGIYCIEASPVITGCRISSNKWGINAYDNGLPIVTNCIFRGNAVTVLSYGYSNPRLVNCTFWLNSLPLKPIGDYPTAITVSNCILWGSQRVVDLSTAPLGSVDISYSDVEGSWPGEGNIQQDPEFVNPYSLDFRVQPTSPCIDAGFNSPDLPEFDIAGMHRIMFGGKSLTVDMGAYEFYINNLDPVLGTNEAIFTWSSLADKSYSIFYTDDLLNWHTAIAGFPSSGNQTTSWLDDGSLTVVPPSLAPRRFYRVLENP